MDYLPVCELLSDYLLERELLLMTLSNHLLMCELMFKQLFARNFTIHTTVQL